MADASADPFYGSFPGAVEMVEVKNTCPFRTQVRVNRKGTTRSCFVVADRGPRDQVALAPFSQMSPESRQEFLLECAPARAASCSRLSC